MATSLFKNGRIVDGSGRDAFVGSVLGVHVVKDGACIEGVRPGRALRC